MVLNDGLLGLFSGFPTHHFTDEIAKVLSDNLPKRNSLVFISAWPEDYERNDDDKDGMHEMFVECGMAFGEHYVIDRRTEKNDAIALVKNADCIFLMGGDVVLQMKMIRELDLVPPLLASHAVILGVSAGAMNLGKYVAEVWETMSFHEGVGLTGFVTKGHYTKDAWFIPTLMELSMVHPVIAMEDESAIFIKNNVRNLIGQMYLFNRGKITILDEETIGNI